MFQLLNTLYVTVQGTYLHIDHETLKLEQEGKTLLQVPLHHLSGVVVFGNVLVSPFAISRCADEGKMMVFLDRNGDFKAKVTGSTTGNILLRRAQHRTYDSSEKTIAIAQNIVAGKIQNSRNFITRTAREAKDGDTETSLRQIADSLTALLKNLENFDEVEKLRGIEGQAAKSYFSAFNYMLKAHQDFFNFTKRTRRPPRDPINCLISFAYTLLLNDCIAAVENIGLDPQLGYLHAIRPGKPSLALDIMEEFRSVIADRLVIALINRKQIQPDDFEERAGGAFRFRDAARKTLLVAYQERKQEMITHPFLKQKMPMGLVPHIQARLLARHLRGDMDAYIPFIPK